MISIRNFNAVAVAVLAIVGNACGIDDGPPPAGVIARADLRGGGPARPRAVTFINPVLPGDHPDMNVFVEGKDFYMTGSDFNMTPNVEIAHSTDLVHWERISRVVSPEWPELRDSTTGIGTWGGFIVKVARGYRVYFAANFHQFFAEAPSLAGPWTDPTPVNMFPYTPPGAQVSFLRGNGGDNSVFVDDDGKTYMLIKAGQCAWNGLSGGRENNFGVNIVTEIDPVTGMLIPETTRDLSFVNDNVINGGCGDPARDPAGADLTHWAEGPSMTKRDGLYYYFVTTKTECGGNEFVWRSPG